MRTARAKGLTSLQVANRHALPVVTPAIASLTGVNISTLLINVAVIEYGFAIPACSARSTRVTGRRPGDEGS